MSKLITLFILTVFLLPDASHAQNLAETDSIYRLLLSTPGNTNLTFSLNSSIDNLSYSNSDTALYYARQQDSLSLGMKFDEIYHGMEVPGKLKFGVSGCPNQCAETCIKDIGLVGLKNGWKVFVGGNGGGRPRLAVEIAKDLSTEDALILVDKVIEYFKANATGRQRLGAMLEKTGFEEFKAAVLS
jgi:sulfite reductase beta subunit-like hemoprotein